MYDISDYSIKMIEEEEKSESFEAQKLDIISDFRIKMIDEEEKITINDKTLSNFINSELYLVI